MKDLLLCFFFVCVIATLTFKGCAPTEPKQTEPKKPVVSHPADTVKYRDLPI